MQDTQDTQTISTPPRWTVTLNRLDGDCETMPFQFATEAEAKAYGRDWVAKQHDDANYWTAKTEPRTYPAYKFGGRWICEGPTGRFHAKTKQSLIAMLTEVSEA